MAGYKVSVARSARKGLLAIDRQLSLREWLAVVRGALLANDEAERRLGALGPAGSDVSRPGADGDRVAKHRQTKAPTRH